MRKSERENGNGMESKENFCRNGLHQQTKKVSAHGPSLPIRVQCECERSSVCVYILVCLSLD